MGAAGSNATSPQLKLFTTVAMFSPEGSGQYAPGSSSCADRESGTSSSANTVAATRLGLRLTAFGDVARPSERAHREQHVKPLMGHGSFWRIAASPHRT